MPIYDYECRSCGHVVEVLHGVNATGPTACEVCGGPMRKLMSTPAIVFKGSGWAKKDARDARSTSKSNSSTAKDGAGTSPAATESGSTGESGTASESTPSPKSGEAAASSGDKGSSTSSAPAD